MEQSSINTIKPTIRAPSSDDLSIWRYMDFTKFVAILLDRALFFPRLDQLGDPFEGAFPTTQPIIQRIQAVLPKSTIPPGAKVTVYGLHRAWESTRRWTYASCWHCEECESAAMWRLYAHSNEAIAIRSTVRQLRRVLADPGEPDPGFLRPRTIHLGMVDYIDFNSDQIPPDFVSRGFRKRKSFEHERELRALFMELPSNYHHDMLPDHRGRSIPIEPRELITEIYVAPQASEWYAELVRKIAIRFNIDVAIKKSALDDSPLY